MSSEGNNKIGLVVMQLAIKFVLIIVLGIIFIVTISRAYHLGYEVFDNSVSSSNDGYEMTFVIGENETTKDVARHLKRAGLIKEITVFEIQKIFYDLDIKPGTYKISTSSTSKELLQQFNDGEKPIKEDEE
ncbi:hypothetical protein P261_01906 [Lachnospiraceae bacterium TWA4]|nr:hypothetical protein P261_01906 [Lachnospiraceae bacterium TWA4]